MRVLVLWGEYLQSSIYDFDNTMTEKTIDFSRDDYDDEIPDVADDDGKLVLDVRAPSNHRIRAMPLWRAAVNDVIMTEINVEIAVNNLTKEKVVGSRLLKPSPNNDLDEPEWKTVTEEVEHHLCLPYHRLIGEQKHLLKRGGVSWGATDDVEEVDSVVEIDMGLVDDPLSSDEVQPESFNDLDSAQVPVTRDDEDAGEDDESGR
ncbi:hypothetical protein D3261_10460 [Halococcus sp. IIIV-5B]|nr:hypothetical protein D3261_10460 [Halococcus sp. IIIV-5B]